MDAIDIGVTGIFAIVLLYGAFGLLIIETGTIYRDIRLALSIRNAEANRLPELPKTACVPRPSETLCRAARRDANAPAATVLDARTDLFRVGGGPDRRAKGQTVKSYF